MAGYKTEQGPGLGSLSYGRLRNTWEETPKILGDANSLRLRIQRLATATSIIPIHASVCIRFNSKSANRALR